jgi:hypothetical protein
MISLLYPWPLLHRAEIRLRRKPEHSTSYSGTRSRFVPSKLGHLHTIETRNSYAPLNAGRRARAAHPEFNAVALIFVPIVRFLK